MHPLLTALSLLSLLSLLATTVLAGPLAPTLQQFVDDHRISGAVALVAGKDKVLDVETVGYSRLATRQPMQADSVFWIASMTKSITATAFMMLVDEGKVSVSDPVEKYLPEFKGQMVVEGKDKTPHKPQRPITIRDVLSHTSGVTSTVKTKCVSLKEDVAAYAAAPLKREPGTKYEYNNAGIDTAGRIIEVLSGMSYGDFLQKRLLDPLGMKETTFWPNEQQVQRLARTSKLTADKSGLEDVHLNATFDTAKIKPAGAMTVPVSLLTDYNLSMIPTYQNRFAMPAGGLFSTAADVGKLCQMLLNGGTWQGKRYVSEAAIKEMTANQTGNLLVSPREAYGLGWFVQTKPGDSVHSVGSYGHHGARKTMMWIDPQNELVMVLLVQRFDMSGEDSQKLHGAFVKAAIEAFGKNKASR